MLDFQKRIFYTRTGQKTGENAVCAFYGPNTVHEKPMRLPGVASAFTCEIYAIIEAIQYSEQVKPGSQVVIEFLCIPAHCVIRCNEKANLLPKEGAIGDHKGQQADLLGIKEPC